MHQPRERGIGGQMVAGAALVAVGLYFLLVNLGVVELDVPWRWTPLVLVAIGAGRLATAASGEERRGGVWLILIGAWLLANFHGAFGLHWGNSWPLLIVAVGALMVWGALARPARAPEPEAGEGARAGDAGGEAR